MPASARVPCAAAVLVAALATACGGGDGSSTAASGAAARVPGSGHGLSSQVVHYPAAGISFRPPSGWALRPGRKPLVAVAQNGTATVAVWRYPRSEQLPFTHPALEAAKEALVAQIVKRDPKFRLFRAKLLHVGTERAVQVLGIGTLGGTPRTIRSTHIYAERAEYVVDCSAPQGVFKRADATVFQPLLKTIVIARPGPGK